MPLDAPQLPERPESGGGRLPENIMHFARVLRSAGLPVGPGQVIRAIEAADAVGIGTRDDFYWTLHAVFVNRRDQRDIFDQAFHVFWRNPKLLERLMSVILPTALIITTLSYTSFTTLGALLGKAALGVVFNIWLRRVMSAAFVIYGVLLGASTMPRTGG